MQTPTTWKHRNPNWPTYTVRPWAQSETMIEVIDTTNERIVLRDYPELVAAKLSRNGYEEVSH